jgi:hypothetical protein
LEESLASGGREAELTGHDRRCENGGNERKPTMTPTPEHESDSRKPGKPIRLIFPRGATGEEMMKMLQESMARQGRSLKTPKDTSTPSAGHFKRLVESDTD